MSRASALDDDGADEWTGSAAAEWVAKDTEDGDDDAPTATVEDTRQGGGRIRSIAATPTGAGTSKTPKQTKSGFFSTLRSTIVTAPYRAATGTRACLVKKKTWSMGFYTALNALKGTAWAAPRSIAACRLLTDHAIPKVLLPKEVQLTRIKEFVPANLALGLPALHAEVFSLRPVVQHAAKSGGGGGGSGGGGNDAIAAPTTAEGKLVAEAEAERGGRAAAPAPPASAATVLYVHGGAFCCCSSSTHRSLLARIVAGSGARLVALDYRRPPEDPFPAALDDVLRTYRQLVAGGVDPASILLAGDSAGGGLCLSALVALRDDESAALPAGAMLLSPWVDLSETPANSDPDGSFHQNHLADYLPHDLVSMFAAAYAGDTARIDPKLSPGLAELHGLPPLLVEVGSAEILHDQIVAMVAKARATGTDVRLEVAPEMVHVYQLLVFAANKKKCPCPRESIARIVAFVHERCGGSGLATSGGSDGGAAGND